MISVHTISSCWNSVGPLFHTCGCSADKDVMFFKDLYISLICGKAQSGASLFKSSQMLAVFVKNTDSSNITLKVKSNSYGSSVLT